MIHIRVLGLASIASDVSPQLALATIASVEVLGAFRASTAVKAALAARTSEPAVIPTVDRTASPRNVQPSGPETSEDNREKGYRHECTPDGGDG